MQHAWWGPRLLANLEGRLAWLRPNRSANSRRDGPAASARRPKGYGAGSARSLQGRRDGSATRPRGHGAAPAGHGQSGQGREWSPAGAQGSWQVGWEDSLVALAIVRGPRPCLKSETAGCSQGGTTESLRIDCRQQTPVQGCCPCVGRRRGCADGGERQHRTHPATTKASATHCAAFQKGSSRLLWAKSSGRPARAIPLQAGYVRFASTAKAPHLLPPAAQLQGGRGGQQQSATGARVAASPAQEERHAARPAQTATQTGQELRSLSTAARLTQTLGLGRRARSQVTSLDTEERAAPAPIYVRPRCTHSRAPRSSNLSPEP